MKVVEKNPIVQAEKNGYIGWCQNKAHEEIDYIFRKLMPKHGLNVREEQLRLSHEMLDTLWGKQIALCDAGVGIGKTYAYLIACIMLDKYGKKGGCISKSDCHPAVISTSNIALQDAILKEYVPFFIPAPAGRKTHSETIKSRSSQRKGAFRV